MAMYTVGVVEMAIAAWCSLCASITTCRYCSECVLRGSGEPWTTLQVRGDRGRENKGIAVYMILTKGANRGSFIWGPYGEEDMTIRPMYVTTLELSIRLHTYLYVGFTFYWTPTAWRIPRDCDNIPPEEITMAYGVDTIEVPSDSVQNGPLQHVSDDEGDIEADGSDDEEQQTWSAFEQTLGAEYAANFLPKTVAAPKAVSPFTEDGGTVFAETLATVHQNHFLPQGFGVQPEEWSGSEYPGYENLRLEGGLNIAKEEKAKPAMENGQLQLTWNYRGASHMIMEMHPEGIEHRALW
ncbi:Integrase catalytic domain-containing protein [Salix suchowensis]|nr:Integrase catalytic domain-containing protein [Salix suchowensis]